MECFQHVRTGLVVSDDGDVWCPAGVFELPQYVYGKYFVVDWKDRREYVHVLVLEAACHQFTRVKKVFPIVDHINQCKLDDRLENLRPATATLNRLNDDSIRGFFRIPGAKKRPFKVEIRIKRKLVFSQSFAFSFDARRAYKSQIQNQMHLLWNEGIEAARRLDEFCFVPSTKLWVSE